MKAYFLTLCCIQVWKQMIKKSLFSEIFFSDVYGGRLTICLSGLGGQCSSAILFLS